jgi:hypothetical protein
MCLLFIIIVMKVCLELNKHEYTLFPEGLSASVFQVEQLETTLSRIL